MGFTLIKDMATALSCIKQLPFSTVGTITLDSYTRLKQYKAAFEAINRKSNLNGFPLLCYSPDEIKAYLSSQMDQTFRIQVRHGSPLPDEIIDHMIKADLTYTEGGPISYCLPYGRIKIKDSIASWKLSCEKLSSLSNQGHLESFAGCMLGQLCPPSLLVALNILEGLFFKSYGLRDISLSYAQYYNLHQDVAAIRALQSLANKYLSYINFHVVVYTFMGLFPETHEGWKSILCESVKLLALSKSKRLIVKTSAESSNIPSLVDNITALKTAYEALNDQDYTGFKPDQVEEEQIMQDADTIIQATLNTSSPIDQALLKGFKKGLIDIPFCIHPDNLRETIATIDDRGYICWVKKGNVPAKQTSKDDFTLSSDSLLKLLNFNKRQYDHQRVN
jgi:methylaspartate mutase epsilon subunit